MGLQIEIDKNQKLTNQLEALKEQRASKSSKSLSASMMSGEQFTVTVPKPVDPNDIKSAVVNWLQSSGKEFDDFKILQHDMDVFDIEDTTAIDGPLTIVVIEPAPHGSSADCGVFRPFFFETRS